LGLQKFGGEISELKGGENVGNLVSTINTVRDIEKVLTIKISVINVGGN
jgi:hypothetical protein